MDARATMDARAAIANARDGTRGTKLEIPRLDDFRDEESARRFTRANRWLSVDLLAFPVRRRASARRRARTRAKGVDDGGKTTDGWMDGWMDGWIGRLRLSGEQLGGGRRERER